MKYVFLWVNTFILVFSVVHGGEVLSKNGKDRNDYDKVVEKFKKTLPDTMPPGEREKFISLFLRTGRMAQCTVAFFEADDEERRTFADPEAWKLTAGHGPFEILEKSMAAIYPSPMNTSSPQTIIADTLKVKGIKGMVLARDLRTKQIEAYRLTVEDDDTRSVVTHLAVNEDFDITGWLLRKQNEAVGIFWYTLFQKSSDEIVATVPKLEPFLETDEKYRVNVKDSLIGSSGAPNQTVSYAIQIESISGKVPDAYLTVNMQANGDVWEPASWEVTNVSVDEEQTTLHQHDRDVAEFAKKYIHASENERSNMTANGFKARLPSTGEYTIFGKILVVPLGEGKWKAKCKLSHSDNFGMKRFGRRKETIWFYVGQSADGERYVLHGIEVTTKGGK